MDLQKRSIVKMVSFKILTIAVTIPITGLGTALAVHALTTICFYVHERIWNKINWGQSE
jgi:uncharacterized membrane protein